MRVMLLVVPAVAAMAQPVVLTMDDAVEHALRRNPELQVKRASIAVASARIAAAGALPAPEFRLSRNNVDLDPTTLEERTTLGMRYSPPRPRELGLKQLAASARKAAVRSEVDAAEAVVAAEVRHAYRRALIATRRTGIAQRMVELRRTTRSTILRQVSAGLKQADESEFADLALLEAEAEHARTRASESTEMRALARLALDNPGAEFTLAGEKETPSWSSSFLDTVQLTAQALRVRAELEQVSHTCQEFEVNERIARNQRYPWFSFVQVTHRTTTIVDRGAWGFQLGLDLPFFRSAQAADARLATAERSRCETQKHALEARIRREVEESVFALESARRELAELERIRTGAAARALERAQLALAAQRADRTEVLVAEARLLSLEDRWLERRLHYTQLEAQLERAVGGQVAGGQIQSTASLH